MIRPQVDDEEDSHEYVAIDLESEDFEGDANQSAAANRLIERHPEAQGRIWFRRVGSRCAHHFGGGLREKHLNSSAQSDTTLPNDEPTSTTAHESTQLVAANFKRRLSAHGTQTFLRWTTPTLLTLP